MFQGIQFEKKHSKIIVLIFFSIYLAVGIHLYPDYGISWDEPSQRITGEVTLQYLAQHHYPFLQIQKMEGYPNLNDYEAHDYGVAFEAPLIILEQLFHLNDTHDIFLFRHLMTFLFSILGLFALYKIAAKRFDDFRIGLLTIAFMILSPRFFAESFYNDKDIVFMAAFALAIYTMILFLAKPNFSSSLTHGLTTALAIDIRVMGTLVLACTLVILIIKLIKKELWISDGLKFASIYLIATCSLIITMFPWLWTHPVGHFLKVFKNMAHFRWGGEVFYMGKFISATHLPWHYIPVWIAITTPPLVIILWMIGSLNIIKQPLLCKAQLWSNEAEMQDLIFMGLFLIPILTVILLHSILYDGWRHLYFVYPAMILVATRGFVFLYHLVRSSKIKRNILFLTILMGLFYNAYWIRAAHPLQNVYFNVLAGHHWYKKFDLDYWGLGNRAALQYLIAHDNSPSITICAESSTPLETTLMILNPTERSRIQLSCNTVLPHYILTNYRGIKNKDPLQYQDQYNLFYQKIINKEIILSVYKHKPIA